MKQTTTELKKCKRCGSIGNKRGYLIHATVEHGISLEQAKQEEAEN